MIPPFLLPSTLSPLPPLPSRPSSSASTHQSSAISYPYTHTIHHSRFRPRSASCRLFNSSTRVPAMRIAGELDASAEPEY